MIGLNEFRGFAVVVGTLVVLLLIVLMFAHVTLVLLSAVTRRLRVWAAFIAYLRVTRQQRQGWDATREIDRLQKMLAQKRETVNRLESHNERLTTALSQVRTMATIEEAVALVNTVLDDQTS